MCVSGVPFTCTKYACRRRHSCATSQLPTKIAQLCSADRRFLNATVLLADVRRLVVGRLRAFRFGRASDALSRSIAIQRVNGGIGNIIELGVNTPRLGVLNAPKCS